MTITLPRHYLSATQVTLWRNSKKAYIDQYIRGEKRHVTPAMRFGGDIARLLERNHPSLSFIPRLEFPEHRIEVIVNTVPTLSFLDSFAPPPACTFLEYKTSKNPWTQNMVDTSVQLLFYAAAIKAKYGQIPEYCHLVHLTTEHRTTFLDFGSGNPIESTGEKEIIITGEAKILKRRFTEEEVNIFEKDLLETAKEISEVYRKGVAV